MTFAPEKSLVVAKENLLLLLGDARLPQVLSAKYLGIPFTPSGPDWTANAQTMANKAKATIMMLVRYGFNKNNWCPSAKINVYKLFIRSQMEYGMQVNLYSKHNLETFEKTQQLALRIAYGVPWNTSKTALKRLSCLETMN